MGRIVIDIGFLVPFMLNIHALIRNAASRQVVTFDAAMHMARIIFDCFDGFRRLIPLETSTIETGGS